MTHYQKVIAVLVIATAFSAGRYSVSESKETSETVTVDKTVTDTKIDLDKDKHKRTTIVVQEEPDGTKKTITKITEDTKTSKKTDTTQSNDIKIDSKTSKEVTKNEDKTTISLLVGTDIRLPPGPSMHWGASVIHPILGPVTVGAWGLSNATGGVSLGLQF